MTSPTAAADSMARSELSILGIASPVQVTCTCPVSGEYTLVWDGTDVNTSLWYPCTPLPVTPFVNMYVFERASSGVICRDGAYSTFHPWDAVIVSACEGSLASVMI